MQGAGWLEARRGLRTVGSGWEQGQEPGEYCWELGQGNGESGSGEGEPWGWEAEAGVADGALEGVWGWVT